MITNSIQSCMSAIKDKQALLQNKQSREEYQKILAALDTACKSLRCSLDTIDGLKKYHISDSATMDDGIRNELLEAIDQCGSALESGQLNRAAVTELRYQTNQLQQSVASAWKECSEDYSAGVSMRLGVVHGLSDNPGEIAELKSRITKLTEGDPSAVSAKKLAADVTRAKEIISQFSLKPGIEAFLNKVSSKQATVQDLSPEILHWLEHQKLLTKLKISF